MKLEKLDYVGKTEAAFLADAGIICGWSEKFSASATDGNSIRKIFIFL
jgi:hypothetical protein